MQYQEPAFGVLNELLGLMRGSDGGIAKPSRYEVIFLPPVGNETNVFSTVINAMRGDGTARESHSNANRYQCW